jgi:hypothetical protein
VFVRIKKIAAITPGSVMYAIPSTIISLSPIDSNTKELIILPTMISNKKPAEMGLSRRVEPTDIISPETS